MGHSGQVEEEIALLHSLSADKDVRTVCEIGFNAGHSAVAMLEGHNHVALVEFDLLGMLYSKAAKKALEKSYPNRTRFFQGSSQMTVPQYAILVAADPVRNPPCDLWMVDGDHNTGALLDLRAAVNASRDGAVIVADDCTRKRHTHVVQSWRRMVSAGHIRPEFETELSLPPPAGNKGWCVGRAVRWPGDGDQLSAEQEGASRQSGSMIDIITKKSMLWLKHG